MTIYVGNLNFQASENDLNNLFAEFGEVTSVRIMKDKFTGRARGFAFVELASPDQEASAISALHEKDFMTRKLVVNEAKAKS
jgi:RNA recognition motif-containing protein